MPGMVAEATAVLGSDARFRIRQMDAQKLNLPNDSFDTVIANHMLYHIQDRPRALAEMRRVLVPGGRLIAATNSQSHLREIWTLVDECRGEGSPINGALPFSLENGEEQLRPCFANVFIHPVRGALQITEAEAVEQYVLSLGEAKQTIVGHRLDQLRRRVQDVISSAGAFVAHTHSGLFIGRKV
jgi:SAM-dependent methyltransferase